MQNDTEMVIAFLLFYAHCSNKCKEREAFGKKLVIFVAGCKKKRTSGCLIRKNREQFGGILVKMFPMALAYLGASPEARSVS